MSFDMSDPAARARANDRFLAGICPTLGPQPLTKERRHRMAERFTRERLAREAEDPEKAKVEEAKRRAELVERMTAMYARPRLPQRPKPTLVRLARENLERSLEQSRPRRPVFVPIPRSKGAFTSGRRSDASKAPASSTYSVPCILAIFANDSAMQARVKAQRREMRDRALAEQARALAEGAMRPVFAQILEVGAAKRRVERREVGPAPTGLHFIQDGDNVLLARIDDEWDAGMLVGVADEITIVRN
ncbi:hypothetical protein R3P38DRAFT_3228218 [Favolaschia claudopus]|uniref:Uncharacterized protein n=1 Tax=Favolaschia claudopus TaxID=2862362 RepID=A0AAV9ZRW6_9AGAR